MWRMSVEKIFWVKFTIDRGGEIMVLYEAMIGEGMCLRHESKK